MTKVVSIYEAKTHLSKLIKQAQAGETIYIGAYGNPQVILAPAPVKQPINVGVWAHKKLAHAYKTEELVGPDPEISADFEDSLSRSL